MRPPPSSVYTRFTLPAFWKTFWLVSVMVAAPPQLNVILPPAPATVATALENAASVQLAGLPLPTTTSVAKAIGQGTSAAMVRTRRRATEEEDVGMARPANEILAGALGPAGVLRRTR